MFTKTSLKNLSYTRHPVNINDVISFIRNQFSTLCKKLEIEMNIVVTVGKIEKDYTVLATNNGNSIRFFVSNIKELVALFETNSARKAWINCLIAHELFHSIAPFKRDEFKTEFEYEDYINTKTVDWINHNFPDGMFSIKQEYHRWGKYDKSGIWYTLSFGMEKEWR